MGLEKIREEVHPKERYYLPFARVVVCSISPRGPGAREGGGSYGQIRGRARRTQDWRTASEIGSGTEISIAIVATRGRRDLADVPMQLWKAMNDRTSHRHREQLPEESPMSKLPWKPWHQVVQLRPDVRTGELSLSQFAADLYDVIMDRGAPSIALRTSSSLPTYPTYNLRELAKDVVHRLAGKNDKTIRQFELTYSGE